MPLFDRMKLIFVKIKVCKNWCSTTTAINQFGAIRACAPNKIGKVYKIVGCYCERIIFVIQEKTLVDHIDISYEFLNNYLFQFC